MYFGDDVKAVRACVVIDHLRCGHRIFSVERGADGKRSFIVSTYAAFWARYQGMLPQHRHYYEIIRQGWPCHLYFGVIPTNIPRQLDSSGSALSSCMPLVHISSQF